MPGEMRFTSPLDHLSPNPELAKLIPGFRPSFSSDDFLVQQRAAQEGLGAIFLGKLTHRFSKSSLVEPAGPACHTGERTCFHRGELALGAPYETLPALERTIASGSPIPGALPLSPRPERPRARPSPSPIYGRGLKVSMYAYA